MKASVLLLLLSVSLAHAAIFKDNTTWFVAAPAQMSTGAIAWADFNNDGFQDVIIGGANGGTNFFYYELGNGSFFNEKSAQATLVITDGLVDAKAGDYNQDGWVDVLATFNGGAVIRLFQNVNGKFSTVTLPNAPTDITNAGRLAFADFNGDSWLDVVVTTGANTIYWAKNNKDGTFSDVSSIWNTGLPTPVTAATIAISDYDNDGKPDLFLSGSLSGTAKTWVFKNNGTYFTDVSSTIFGSQTAAILSLGLTAFSFGDFNLDMYADFAALGVDGSSNPKTVLFVNNKNGTFSDYTSNLGGVANVKGTAIAWGDYNGDLYPDLYYQGTTSGNKLHRNQAGTSFVDATTDAFPSNILPGFANGAAQFADADDDGLADDLLVFGTDATGSTTSNAPKLFLSNATIPILKPEMPTIQGVSLSGTSTTKSVTVKTFVRPLASHPVNSFELVLTPNGGKVTKVVPRFNYKTTVQVSITLNNVPVTNTPRKIWLRGVNKAGKGAWATATITI